MNKKQAQLLQVFEDVIVLMTGNSTIWATNVPVAEAFGKFTSAVSQFKSAQFIQGQQRTNGYTEQKKQYKLDLIELIYAVAGKIELYAEKLDDKVLKDAVKCTLTGLKAFRAQDLINKSQSIHEQALLVKASGADYGITDDELNRILTLISNFSSAATKRNSVGDKRTTITADVLQYERDSTTLLVSLDKAVNRLIADKNFVDQFNQARKIGDVPSQRKVKPNEEHGGTKEVVEE